MSRRKKSVPWIVFSRLMGLMCFLLVLYLANFIAPQVDFALFHEVLAVLNASIILIVVMSLLFLAGEAFSALPFPIDLASPPFSAFGAVFLVAFLFNLLSIVDSVSGEDISSSFELVALILYPLVFFGVLIGGYFEVFRRLFPEKEKPEKSSREAPAGDWQGVGEEFRQAFSDFFILLGEEIGGRK